MNANPVDLSTVLREGVEASLEPAPVVLVGPIGDQRLSLLEGYVLRPVTVGFPLPPPSVGKSLFEIIQRCLKYMNLEGRYFLCCSGEHNLRSRGGAPLSTYRHKPR